MNNLSNINYKKMQNNDFFFRKRSYGELEGAAGMTRERKLYNMSAVSTVSHYPRVPENPNYKVTEYILLLWCK